MSLQKNIKAFRLQQGLTQAELAAKLGVDRSSVTQWETGVTTPRMKVITKLSTLFNTTPSVLISDSSTLIKLPISGSTATLPLRTLGKVHAGVMDDDDACDDEEIQVPETVVQMHPSAFVLRVEGDCMNKIIPEGCHVAVDTSATPHNGSIVVVENEQYEHIMRKYYRGSSVVVLSPDSFNEAYEDIVISGDETLNLVGVVVWWQASEMMD